MSKFDKFLIRASTIHHNKFIYPEQEIKKYITIICPIHDEFQQNIDSHLKGYGCKKCSNKEKINFEIFKEKSEKIHTNVNGKPLYIYIKPETEIENNKQNVNIICKKHGIFTQSIHNHMSGKGCKKCGLEKSGEKQKILFEERVKIAQNIHQDEFGNPLYVYYNDNYKDKTSKLKIFCKSCENIFFQRFDNHIKSCGCICKKESIGEKTIANYLKNKNINFIRQHTFENCRNPITKKKKYSFDFYLPDFNICIEYDGRLHYEPIEYFGGEKVLNIIKNNDKNKTNYCKSNNITLVRIKFDEDIKQKLDNIENTNNWV